MVSGNRPGTRTTGAGWFTVIAALTFLAIEVYLVWGLVPGLVVLAGGAVISWVVMRYVTLPWETERERRGE